MRRRRTLIVLAAVLLASAIAAALVPPPERGPGERGGAGRGTEGGGRSARPVVATPRAGTARTPAAPAPVRFDAGAPAPQTRRVRRGTHAVVTVAAPVPGQVTVAGLGLEASADPITPAEFDFLATRPGRFAVTFAPAGEPARQAGTLVVSD